MGISGRQLANGIRCLITVHHGMPISIKIISGLHSRYLKRLLHRLWHGSNHSVFPDKSYRANNCRPCPRLSEWFGEQPPASYSVSLNSTVSETSSVRCCKGKKSKGFTGRVNQKVEPLPYSENTPISPPSFLIMVRLIDNPKPVPLLFGIQFHETFKKLYPPSRPECRLPCPAHRSRYHPPAPYILK